MPFDREDAAGGLPGVGRGRVRAGWNGVRPWDFGLMAAGAGGHAGARMTSTGGRNGHPGAGRHDPRFNARRSLGLQHEPVIVSIDVRDFP